MPPKQLYGQIRSLVNIHDNDHYAEYDLVEKSFYLTEQISHALRAIYSSLKGREEAPYTLDELADALKLFYDEYVAPIDLPMNDFFERIVDSRIKDFFGPALHAIQGRLADKGVAE